MRARYSVPSAPGPLETYCQQFDDLLTPSNQRACFRRYLEGLLLPQERNKTLTALANTEPVVGAQHPRAQTLQWFLSESTWDPQQVNARRVALLCADPQTAPTAPTAPWAQTAPTAQGVLIIDEHGDRKWGSKTAHVGRQYLANLGKTDNGVVSVTSLWADEGIYYPLHYEPYTQAHHFAQGKADPHFHTKPQIAWALVQQARSAGVPFRAVVADSFYGNDAAFAATLRTHGVSYVLAVPPSTGWWHPEGTIGSLLEAAATTPWEGAAQPGAWVAIERHYRDGHQEVWWALEVRAGSYGPDARERGVVVTTDPRTFPRLSTWVLVTNLPAPGAPRVQESSHPAADLAEIVRLYSLRIWVEQSYKQTKYALGWSDYQVRSDLAMRRHWALVCCAFSFCWWHRAAQTQVLVPAEAERAGYPALADAKPLPAPLSDPVPTESGADARGEKRRDADSPRASALVLASGPADGAGLVGASNPGVALLAGVVHGTSTRTPQPPAHSSLAGPLY